jgi:hypothetical protein
MKTSQPMPKKMPPANESLRAWPSPMRASADPSSWFVHAFGRGGATTWPTLGPAPAWLWLVLLQAARPSAAFGAPATMAAASTPQARRLSSADATSCCELLREPAAASGAAAQLLCKVAAHGTYSQKYSP